MSEVFKDYSANKSKANQNKSKNIKDTKRSKKDLEFDNSWQSKKRTSYSKYVDVNESREFSNRNKSYQKSSRKKHTNKRKKQERLITAGLIFLLLLFAATIFIVIRSCGNRANQQTLILNPQTDQMKENVTINGINVSGMTIDQSRDVVSPSVTQDIQKINITLNGDGFSETISGEQMEASSNLEEILSEALAGGNGKSYKTSITIDYLALSSRIKEINSTLSHGATDATFALEEDSNGKPHITYTEGTPGLGMDVDATQQLIQAALEKGEFSATLTPVLTTIQPSITVSDLKSQVSEIGRYSTTFCKKLPSSDPEEEKTIIENRSYNIEKCTGIINGQVVNPGKTWSFNKIVGDRNENSGWREAKGIYGGETYNMQYGGGVCQVSTTMYVALMRAGIPYKNITRRQHSIPSTYVPKGLDATVDSGHIDFKFKNTTDFPIYIFAYTSPTKNRSRYRDINVVIYGQALPENTTYDLRSVIMEEIEPGEPIITYNKKKTVDFNEVTVEARTGYVVDVYLDTYVNGKLESSEMLYEDRYESITEKRTIGTLPLPTETPDPSQTQTENKPNSTPKVPELDNSSETYEPVQAGGSTDDMP